MEVTEGHLLGGRLAYAQPRTGFRSGIEPVLLAASVAARPGECVLEAGAGAGAALLCLAARLPAVGALGVESDPRLAALAARNIRSNGFSGRLHIVAGDAAAPPFGGLVFDHAICNPPYHPDLGTRSPDPGRQRAKEAGPALLASWAAALAFSLRRHGTLTVILPAAHLTQGMEALKGADCGAVRFIPLWPRAGQPAKLLLLCGRKGGRGGCQMLPGLVLHDADGRFTPEAEDVLRGGEPIP